MALQPKSSLGLYLLPRGRHLLTFRNNKDLRCEAVSLTTNPRQLWGTYDFLLGFTPLATSSSFKELKTRPPSHSHLLHNLLCIAPGPPRGGWEFGFGGRACRLNTQEAFWYLTGNAYCLKYIICYFVRWATLQKDVKVCSELNPFKPKLF
jgi:hypothetical protein